MWGRGGGRDLGAEFERIGAEAQLPSLTPPTKKALEEEFPGRIMVGQGDNWENFQNPDPIEPQILWTHISTMSNYVNT